jgi:nitronate monooxygenase/enoyl-[acyl-carrier protein] reductase II
LGGTGLADSVLRDKIKGVRASTTKPFGVNVILVRMAGHEIETCLDEKVPLLVLFWGDPAPYVQKAQSQGTKVFLQVGSVAEARATAKAGVDVIIAQGVEVGGHVRGTTSLSILLPRSS